MEESWTILKVLQWTTGYFNRKGIPQARANAEVLLAHVLGLERIQLYLRHDQPLSPAELARYREAVQRRASREPTQYILARQEFWSLELEVTPAVLIPRPETELLVEKALALLEGEPKTVLDLCTGSGAIAIALAHELPSITITATDVSTEALMVARRNATRYNLQDRIRFVAMDLFEGFSPSTPHFDLIVSNPPYVGEAEFPSLSPEVAQHEPASALRGGGPEGLEFIRRLLKSLPRVLKPSGTLLMEIGQGQAELLEAELSQNPLIECFQFIRDYSGILRVLHLCKVNR